MARFQWEPHDTQCTAACLALEALNVLKVYMLQTNEILPHVDGILTCNVFYPEVLQ